MIALCEARLQRLQTSGIFFKFGQLILAIHVDDLFQEIHGLMKPSRFFVTLSQYVPGAARAELIARPLGNGLTGLAARDCIVVALLNQEGASYHAPGIGDTALIVQTPHQHQ
jgi:hypothetical protein